MADFSYISRQQNDVKTERTRIFNICYEKNTNKLETVSIAEPLQNRQHVQRGTYLVVNRCNEVTKDPISSTGV